MMKKMADGQRGLSMIGFLMGAVVFILLAIGAMKIIPVYVQAQSIKSQLTEIAHDPAMKDAPAQAIRDAFTRRASVADITQVKAEDIEITKDQGGIFLSVEYSVKVPLVANASLLFEFKTGGGYR